MLRSIGQVAESNNNEVLGFIASTVETIRDRVEGIEQRMATKEDLARLDGCVDVLSGRVEIIEQGMATKQDMARLEGRFNEKLDVATTSIRGDIEQVQLRLDSMEHSVASRFELVEGQISRLRSAVYLLGKDDPDVLRLLGHQNS